MVRSALIFRLDFDWARTPPPDMHACMHAWVGGRLTKLRLDSRVHAPVHHGVHGLLLHGPQVLSQGAGLPAVRAQNALHQGVAVDVVGVQLVEGDDDVRAVGCGVGGKRERSCNG